MNSDHPFGAIRPEWRQKYLKRTPEQLAADMVAACDQLRQQRKEINSLRAQLILKSRINVVMAAILGGAAAKGLEVVGLALLHHLAR